MHWRARWKLDRPVSLALRLYGRDAVKLETLVIADDWRYLCELEKRAILAFGTKWPLGLNKSSGGQWPSGHTEETRKKLSDAAKRNPSRLGTSTSAEARANMSAAFIGRKLSDSARANIGASMIGNKHCLGHKYSDDRKRRMSDARLTPGLPPCKRGASGHRGVSYDPVNKRWRAHITIDGKMHTLGRFDDIQQAADARRLAEIARHEGVM